MEGEVAAFDSPQDQIFIDDIDVDSILQGFPQDYDHDLDLWLSNLPSDDSSSAGELETPIDLSLFAEEIEKFLMDDAGGDQGDQVVDGGDKYVDDFLAGVLVDGSGSDNGRSEVASPESGGSESEDGKEMGDGVVVIDGEEREEEEEDEQISKNRRRYFY